MIKVVLFLFLVWRLLKGLLVGLWEFLFVFLDNFDSLEKFRLIVMDKYLYDILGVEFGRGGYFIMKWEEFGIYVYVFLYICFYMFI